MDWEGTEMIDGVSTARGPHAETTGAAREALAATAITAGAGARMLRVGRASSSAADVAG